MYGASYVFIYQSDFYSPARPFYVCAGPPDILDGFVFTLICPDDYATGAPSIVVDDVVQPDVLEGFILTCIEPENLPFLGRPVPAVQCESDVDFELGFVFTLICPDDYATGAPSIVVDDVVQPDVLEGFILTCIEPENLPFLGRPVPAVQCESDVDFELGYVVPQIPEELPLPATEIVLSWTFVGGPFLYTAANWSGIQFYFETYMRATAGTVNARLANAANGVAVAGSTLSTTSASLIRQRSGVLTLTDGVEYRAQQALSPGSTGKRVEAQVIAIKI